MVLVLPLVPGFVVVVPPPPRVRVVVVPPPPGFVVVVPPPPGVVVVEPLVTGVHCEKSATTPMPLSSGSATQNGVLLTRKPRRYTSRRCSTSSWKSAGTLVVPKTITPEALAVAWPT